jgi:uncharacterized protein
MNRSAIGAAALALIGLSFAACTSKTENNVATSLETTGITVSGHGEVVAVPDTGFFDVGVQVTAPTVAEARERAAASADAVIKSVKANGVDAKDVQTSQFTINPQYRFEPNTGTPTIIGYQVVNTVAVKVRKLDAFSKILDDATAAGGDDTLLQGIRFGLEDSKKALEEARALAIADAKAKAEQLASLAGVKVGDPIAISEVNTVSTPDIDLLARNFPAAPATGGPSTPIETGSGKVTLDVTVRWAIAR